MIRNRILKYIEYKGISKYKFYKEIGVSNGFLDKEGSVRSDICEKISYQYLDLNLIWLISGTGEMILNKDETAIVNEPRSVYSLKSDINLDTQKIPLYDIQAIAGITPVFLDINSQEPIDFLHIPNAPKSDGAIYASGDSMYPKIKSRDILGFKVIKDLKNDIFWGKTYILDLSLNDDDLLTIKYINRGSDENHIVLTSENKHYQDKEIHLSKIRSLALVKIIVNL